MNEKFMKEALKEAMKAYGKFNDGKMTESPLSEDDIQKSLKTLPELLR